MNYIGPDELIYNNDGGIHSGGFSVNSIMLKSGLSPIMTLNGNNNVNTGGMQMGGNKVSDLFNNLVIPSGFLSYDYKKDFFKGGDIHYRKKNDHDENDDHDDNDDIANEDLHDKLLNLVKVDKTEMQNKSMTNKKTTKKNLNAGRKNKKNTTKKN